MSNFSFKPSRITSFITAKSYSFIPASELNESEKLYKRVFEICNEDLIYKTLFHSMCKGRAYSLEDAKGFISWAKSGFLDKSHKDYICFERVL